MAGGLEAVQAEQVRHDRPGVLRGADRHRHRHPGHRPGHGQRVLPELRHQPGPGQPSEGPQPGAHLRPGRVRTGHAAADDLGGALLPVHG